MRIDDWWQPLRGPFYNISRPTPGSAGAANRHSLIVNGFREFVIEWAKENDMPF